MAKRLVSAGTRLQTELMPLRLSSACAGVVASASARNPRASTKVLLPEPFGPMSTVRGPSVTSTARRLR